MVLLSLNKVLLRVVVTNHSMICGWYLAIKYHSWYFKLSQILFAKRLVKLRITISKYHSWYLCQISLQSRFSYYLHKYLFNLQQRPRFFSIASLSLTSFAWQALDQTQVHLLKYIQEQKKHPKRSNQPICPLEESLRRSSSSWWWHVSNLIHYLFLNLTRIFLCCASEPRLNALISIFWVRGSFKTFF